MAAVLEGSKEGYPPAIPYSGNGLAHAFLRLLTCHCWNHGYCISTADV
jgi:hypothetical protein